MSGGGGGGRSCSSSRNHYTQQTAEPEVEWHHCYHDAAFTVCWWINVVWEPNLWALRQWKSNVYVYMYRSSSRQITKKSSDDPFHHHETVFVGDEFCRSIRGTNIEWFLIVTLFETQMMVGQRQIIEFMVSPMISASFLFPICIECVIWMTTPNKTDHYCYLQRAREKTHTKQWTKKPKWLFRPAFTIWTYSSMTKFLSLKNM